MFVRYGKVYLAEYRLDRLAVKIFSPRDVDSWVRECEIHQTTMLRHDNIVGFIAADIKGEGREENETF